MTLGEWLDARSAGVPVVLAQRVRAVVAPARDAAAADAPELLLDAAERMLGRIVEGDATTRDAALELLTVDALVTYAFEVAADDPSRLAERARTAMERLAAVARRAA